MTLGLRRRPPDVADRAQRPPRRPVLLATFDLPLVEEAASVAVETALETGLPLLVVNVIEGAFFPGPGAPVEAIVTDEVERSLREPAELAHSLGVETARLRVLTPHPVDALVELVQERRAGLLVLGSDPDLLRRRLRTRLERRVRERTSCLVWGLPEAD